MYQISYDELFLRKYGGPETGSCEHGNESLGSIKDGLFTD
jgi:hypothetical protein